MSTVGDIASVLKIIREHEVETSTTYRAVKSDKHFGTEQDIDFSKLDFTIRYEDTQKNADPPIIFDGTPFIIRGKKILECHQGKDRDKKKKEAAKLKRSSKEDHDFRKRRRLTQTTKKKDCPAMVKIRHIIKFVEFKLPESPSSHDREKMSALIRSNICNGIALRHKHVYVMSIPDKTDHKNHFIGEVASLVQPMDDMLKKYIKQMVIQNHITNPKQMKVFLEVYLREDLFKNESIPSRLNSRFWPSNQDIRNHIFLALMEVRNSTVDQDIVADRVKRWKEDFPDDYFVLRLKETTDSSTNNTLELPEPVSDDEECVFDSRTTQSLYGSSKKFLFVHQTSAQRRLLLRYGNEISLLDATYRTTHYALPVFFLCVPTNCNYLVVATFITETEDTSSIQEAVGILKNWNPLWKPKYFMCDYADEEITALENVFPDAMVYLCDFHREQSWERWLGTSANGLIQNKSTILSMLREIAKSSSEQEFHTSESVLKESSAWNDNERFRNWFQRYWLNKSQRWVQAYRHDRFNACINTNNGVERMNKCLKYEYLEMKKAPSLSSLLGTLIDNFLPDTHKRYLRLNVSFAEETKSYNADIPSFLHNRPKTVVDQGYKRWLESANIPTSDIDHVEDGLFYVKSQQLVDRMYAVNFNSDSAGLPSCDCIDWQRSHLLCKHFMAVIRNVEDWSWESLPITYRQNPFIVLDLEDSIPDIQSVPCGQASAITSPDLQQGGNMESNETSDTTETSHNNEPETVVPNEPVELPITNARALKQARSKILGMCQLMKEWVYHCKDLPALNDTGNQMQSLLVSLRSSLAQEGPFIHDDNAIINVAKHQKTSTNLRNNILPTNATKLPLCRSRKRGGGRHGVRAEQKKASISKGIEKVASSEEHEVHVIEEQVEVLDTADCLYIPTLESSETDLQEKDGLSKEASNFKKRKLDQLQEQSNIITKQVKFKDPLEEVQHMERTKKTVRQNRIFHVAGFTIDQNSLDNLDSELPDEVMDAFISLKTRHCKNKSVYFLTTAMVSSIFLEPVDVNEPFSAHGFLSEVNFENYEMLIGALGERDIKHWSLMAIFPQERQLLYMNPMGETAFQKEQYMQNWLLFLNERCNLGIGEGNLEWQIISRPHRKQIDSISCGVFTLEFAKLVLDDDEDYKFDCSKRGISALRQVIGQFLIEHSDEESEDPQRSGVSNDPQTSGTQQVDDKSRPRLRKPRIIKKVKNPGTKMNPPKFTNWLFNAVSARDLMCQRITSCMCGIEDDMPMTIERGFSVVKGQNLATLFEDYVEAKLKNIINMTDGDPKYYKPHWRHIRWVKIIPLGFHLEMKNSLDGNCARGNTFGNSGLKELHALVLSTFGIWKRKTKIRVGYTNNFYLSVKTENAKLLETLEDVMPQNINAGFQYFMDVLFVEAEILTVAHLQNITVSEADKLLYPTKKVKSS